MTKLVYHQLATLSFAKLPNFGSAKTLKKSSSNSSYGSTLFLTNCSFGRTLVLDIPMQFYKKIHVHLQVFYCYFILNQPQGVSLPGFDYLGWYLIGQWMLGPYLVQQRQEDPPFLLEGVPTSFCLNWIIDEQFRFMSGVHSNENC